MGQLAQIQNILRQIKPELVTNYHVNSIGLFGSVVRDELTSTSDIDIIVDFIQPVGVELLTLQIL